MARACSPVSLAEVFHKGEQGWVCDAGRGGVGTPLQFRHEKTPIALIIVAVRVCWWLLKLLAGSRSFTADGAAGVRAAAGQCPAKGAPKWDWGPVAIRA